jgi:hypothetical protein
LNGGLGRPADLDAAAADMHHGCAIKPAIRFED